MRFPVRSVVALMFAHSVLFARGVGQQPPDAADAAGALMAELAASGPSNPQTAARYRQILEEHQPADAREPNAADALTLLSEAAARFAAAAAEGAGPEVKPDSLAALVREVEGEALPADWPDRAGRVVEAARKSGVLGLARQAALARRALPAPPDRGPLMTWTMPWLGEGTTIARLQVVRLRLAALNADDAELIAAFDEGLAVSRAVGHGGNLISRLVAHATGVLVQRNLRVALAERRWPRTTLDALHGALERQAALPAWTLHVETERLMTADSFDVLFDA